MKNLKYERYLLALVVFLITSSCQAQDCDIFNNKTTIRDTIVIKGIWTGLVKLPQGEYGLKYLEQKNILRAYDFKSTIYLKIPKCNQELHFSLKDDSKEAREIISKGTGQELLFTFVIFRYKDVPYYEGKPVIIVTKIRKSE